MPQNALRVLENFAGARSNARALIFLREPAIPQAGAKIARGRSQALLKMISKEMFTYM